MASGDRNYDIATETTQQQILTAINVEKKPIRIEKIEPASSSTISRTGKGKLYFNLNGGILTLVIDGVTLIESTSLYAAFEVEFAESFSVSRGNTTSAVNAVALYYE